MFWMSNTFLNEALITLIRQEGVAGIQVPAQLQIIASIKYSIK